MILEALIQKAAETGKNQASAVFQGRPSKCTFIHLPKSGVIPSHVSTTQALLVVMKGLVVFTSEQGSIELNSLSEMFIEPNLLHDLKALEDSTCVLIKEVS
jgi:quercetin dioxygenase-like cupin family protein